MSARLVNWLGGSRGPRRMSPALVGALTVTNLIHTCVIQSRAQESDPDDGDAPVFDAYEEPVMGEYAPTLSPPVTATGGRTPCIAWQPTPSRLDGEEEEAGRAYVGHRWHFLLPTGTAVAEDDLVADVRDEGGAVIVAGPLDIREVTPRRGHTLVRAFLAASGRGPA